jgi:hypothetical protein
MKIIEQLLPAQAEERTKNINAYVQSVPQPYAVETKASFTAFVDYLKGNVTAANAALQTDEGLQTGSLRAKLAYAAAIYRDCRYSLMHRGRLQELGIHNMYREAYEVDRFATINEKPAG